MMTLLSMGFTSCKDDYFDATRYRDIIRSAFPVDNVDPQHTWSTLETSEINVAVNLKEGETYKVKVYQQNPVDKPEQLTILASGTVKNGTIFHHSFTHSVTTDRVYVALFDQEGYMTVYPQEIVDGKVNASIGTLTWTSRSSRRAIKTSFSFPEAPNATDYAASKPAEAVLINGYQNGNLFYVDESVNGWGNTIQPNGNDIRLYVVGNVDLRQRGFYIPGGTTLYVLQGANLTLPDNFSFGQYQDRIYVSEGGTLTVGGTLQLAANCQLYNRGSVATDSVAVTNSALLYNEGTIQLPGGFAVTNGGSVIVNDNTMTGRTLGVYGSGHVQNNGQMTIAGQTIINSQDNTWVNNGIYTTRNFDYSAAARDVINNCKLTVTELMNLHQSDWMQNCFQNDAGASVQTKDFIITTSNVKMGANSIIKVTGTATMHETKQGYGIKAVGNDYAVFQANRVVMGNNQQGFEILYDGKLYVASDQHFAQGHDGDPNHPFYVLSNGAALTTLNGANAHFIDNGCGAAYEGRADGARMTENEQPLALRYCFEDNFPDPGDYDFNDAVVSVSPSVQGNTVTLRVSIDAVGAQKQIAGALRIVGLKESDVKHISRDVDLSLDAPGSLDILGTNEPSLPESMKSPGTTDVVLCLFNDIHWALGHRDNGMGSVLTWFINTVERDNAYEYKLNDVEPTTTTFTIELNDSQKAALFTQAHMDLFIIEGYNSGYYEVHTVPFKFDEVFGKYAGKGLKEVYGEDDNMPWAICLEGNSFKYPIEWTPITKAYPSFEQWASDHTQATDWFERPISGKVYQ